MKKKLQHRHKSKPKQKAKKKAPPPGLSDKELDARIDFCFRMKALAEE